MVLGSDDGMGAGAVGHAQAGAQVVRVGHAVQHQQQRRPLHAIEQVVQRAGGRQRLRAGDHALVAGAARQPGQPHAVGLDGAQAGLLHLVQELAHARVLAAGIHVDLGEGPGGGAQAHAHCVEAEQDFG